MRAEVVGYDVVPVVIHLINLELAMNTVWMSSKLACCLSCLCMAARMLSSQLLLH